MNDHKTYAGGANIAGVPVEDDENVPYIPRLMNGEDAGSEHQSELPEQKPEYIHLPNGENIAPNGAVIRNPWSEQPEIQPDHEYTEEQEDLNLLIM